MHAESTFLLPLALGVLGGLAALGVGFWIAARTRATAARETAHLVADARAEAENTAREVSLAAQERALALRVEADARERELDERETGLAAQRREIEDTRASFAREQDRLERRRADVERERADAEADRASVAETLARARADLERVAGLTRDQARAELITGIETDAREAAERLARKIEDEARENAERRAMTMMIQASQKVAIRDVVESTVSVIELPSDEMKGRIIGREGRNIRALELATGIDLIVDDTPRSILISSFDPLRREIARVAIDKLVEDGRIHPARIEEVVQKVRGEIDEVVDARGAEAAFGLGISDLHQRLIHSVGMLRYFTDHGQNLLQHSVETATIAAHMCREVGARADIALRAGLLHEIGRTGDAGDGNPLLASAELAARYREPAGVAETIRGLLPDAEERSVEALLLTAANKMSETRPGARKENLAVFVERLKRLEDIACRHDGVNAAYAVKSGKELRVLVDAASMPDGETQALCRTIAREIEREVTYPGQIKVHVVRETRAIRYAV